MRIVLHPNAAWYACAGALLGAYVAFNSQTVSQSDSAVRYDQLLGSTFSNAIKNDPQETLAAELNLSPIYISALPAHSVEQTELTVGRGDTLLGLLQKNKVPTSEAHAAVQALSQIFDPREIRVGQKIYVSKTADNSSSDLDALRIAVAPGHAVMALRSSEETYVPTTLKAKTNTEKQAFSGTIHSSLYEAAIDQGVPATVLVEMIRLFSYDVDFQRDIRAEDRFELMFGQ